MGIELFRQSMINFYRFYRREFVFENTNEVLVQFVVDVLNARDTYHAHILYENMKRMGVKNELFALVYIFEKNPDAHNLFTDIELCIKNGLYKPFLLFAIEYNKPSILDALREITNIDSFVQEMYGIKIDPSMSGIKMIKNIRKKKEYGRVD
jgi:hypothetical protein